jgi:hypothetical protein
MFDNDHPYTIDNPTLYREPTAEEVLAAQKRALDAARRYCEEAKAGRVQAPVSAPQIMPPQLWRQLRDKGWIDENGEWTEEGRRNLWGA